jgi:long-chain acyl-CoA synthetase
VEGNPQPDAAPPGLRARAARYVTPAKLAAWDAVLDATHLGARLLLCCENTVAHVGLLFLLLGRGVSPLLIGADSMAAERQRLASQFDSRHCALLAADGTLQLQALLGGGADASAHPTGIYLLTSGSTGLPSIVFRSLTSWLHESARYRSLLDLHARHSVTLAAPLQHAYTLGWVWAAADAQCSLHAFAPTQLTAIIDALRSDTTHCALTPFVASMLARRAGTGAHPPRLEVVMAGAGPVDAVLDEQFARAFGLPLSRNYGSTESGALFAGLAPQAPQSIGRPMPHLRVVNGDDDGEPKGEPFLLNVELEDGAIFRTGDLVQRDGANFRVVGRATAAIRRGERWISPFEIEAVLSAHPHVAQCRVRAVKTARAGNDHILASIVLREDAAWDESALRQFCHTHLTRAKLPDRFEQVESIARGGHGKVLPSKVYRLAASAALAEAAHACKRAHLLFALQRAGVLEQLDGASSVDQLAFGCGLHADTLDKALDLACLLGLVTEAAQTHSATGWEAPMLRLEDATSQTWNSVDGLLAVLRDGLSARPFDRQPPTAVQARLYQDAMNGGHKRVSGMLAVRKLMQRGARPLAVLDLSATGGAYSRRLTERGLLDPARSRCLPIGTLSGATAASVTVDIEYFDLLVLDNAVHHGAVARQLTALCERLTPDGIVLVDELYVAAGRAAIGVDWLSHGGLHYPDKPSLDTALHALGFVPTEIFQDDSIVCHAATFFTRKYLWTLPHA